MGNIESNVYLPSNVHIIEGGRISKDKAFISSVTDSKCLEKYVELYGTENLSDTQIEHAKNISSCSITDNTVFGIIKDKNGVVRTACRCVNLDCQFLLKRCRKFTSKEKILEEIAAREKLRAENLEYLHDFYQGQYQETKIDEPVIDEDIVIRDPVISKFVVGGDEVEKVTLEELFSGVSKEFVINIMEQYLGLLKEKKQVVTGFANRFINKAPENLVKSAAIDMLHKKAVAHGNGYFITNNENGNKIEGPISEEVYEELYNESKASAFLTLIAEILNDTNHKVVHDVTYKYFKPKVVKPVVYPNEAKAEIEKLKSDVADLQGKYDRVKRDKATLEEKVIKANEQIEYYKGLKKEADKNLDEKEKELNAANIEIANKGEIISRLTNQVLEIDELKNQIAELQEQLQSEKERNKRVEADMAVEYVVYGYPENLYGIKEKTGYKFVSNINDLKGLSSNKNIKTIYYRERSISPMQISRIKNIFTNVEIVVKTLEEINLL